jgi:hypothetical protein
VSAAQPEPPVPTDAGGTADLRPLDERFAELVRAAEVGAALDPRTEDEQMPALLAAGLAAWIGEQAPTGATYKHDPLPGRKPALHGRLIEVLDEATENEAHWCFRAVASLNAIAVISRVRAACTMAGLDREVPQRRRCCCATARGRLARVPDRSRGFDAAGAWRTASPRRTSASSQLWR